MCQSEETNNPNPTRKVESSSFGLRLGLGYGHQVNQHLLLSCDLIMDALGIGSKVDFLGIKHLTTDVFFFHFTLGAHYRFGSKAAK